ncbi:MAG: hypothetical protein AAFP03_11035 [Cyanobacteria bacterium J06598_3]
MSERTDIIYKKGYTYEHPDVTVTAADGPSQNPCLTALNLR